MTNDLLIVRHDTLASTNATALELMDSLSGSALVTARFQTAGRGRRGRRWASPPGVNIYATWALKNPAVPVHAVPWVLALAALGTLRRAAPGPEFRLKWPNDIYCGGKKISGMLCETRLSGGRISGVAAGIGINVNMRREDLEKIGSPATSILLETGRESDVDAMIEDLAKSVSEKYSESLAKGPGHIREEWKSENMLLGKSVEVMTEKGAVRGVFADVGETGELVLLSDGQKRLFNSADVSLKRPVSS